MLVKLINDAYSCHFKQESHGFKDIISKNGNQIKLFLICIQIDINNFKNEDFSPFYNNINLFALK